MLTPGPTIRWAHCVKALLHQNLTQALIVKADSLGNMRQWHPACDQLARCPHLIRVESLGVNAVPDGKLPFFIALSLGVSRRLGQLAAPNSSR